MKRIKIEMVRMNLEKGEAELENVIDLTESYFFKCFEVYRDKKLEENELVEGIIKVVLTEENGLNELKEGIKYNGVKYYEINTTPSGMKLEEQLDDEEEFKVESIFIKEEYKDFIKEFEDSLSGGIIAELEKNESEICINKMVTSKKALGMTGADFIEGLPRICFIDEFEYSYKRKYSFFNENNKIIDDELLVNFVLNDGGGLMTPEYAKRIKEALNKDYDIQFAIIRGYHALAIKGVLLTFDFREYMKSQYKGNTDTFKREGNKYYLKDYFGCWRDLDNIDCIINKSQAKYLGEWKDIVPEGSRWEETLYPLYKDSKYNYVNKGMYISKVNKDPKDLKGKIILNYQVLQNLNVSAQDLIEVAKETVEEFKNVIKLEDINYVKLALGDWVTDISKSSTITNKLNLIIDRFGEECLNWEYIRRELKKHLMKRLNQLSGGKITVEGEICVGVCCPVTYCNFLISGDRGDNGLQEGQFYQGGQVGKRLSYRNPIAYYAEITEVELVNHDLLKGYTPEILFVNAFDDFLFIKSGGDLDGDLFGVVNNETLMNGIIKEDAPFINLDDSKTIPHKFTREQMYEDIWTAAGNLIGEIAIKNSRLCAEVTSYSTLVNKENKVASYVKHKQYWIKEKSGRADTFSKWRNLKYFTSREQYESYREEGWESWEEYNENLKPLWHRYRQKTNELFEEYLKEEEIKFLSDLSQEEQKQLRERMFKKFKNDFFKILYASQIAIDMPKKLLPIPEWLQKELNKFGDFYKPRFMHNLGKCACGGKGDIKECKDIINKVSNNVMDEYSYYIYKELIEPLTKLPTKLPSGDVRGNTVFVKAILGTEKTEINEELVRIYKENSILRKANLGNTPELNKIDGNTFEELEKLGKLDLNVVAYTLKHIKATVRFNFMFMFEDYFLPKLLGMESKTDTIIKLKNNNVTNLKRATKMKATKRKVKAYYWGGEKYVAIKKEKVIDIRNDREENLKKLVKQGLVKRVRFFGGDYTKEIPKTINVKEGKSEIGTMFSGKKDVVLEDGTYKISEYYKVDPSVKGITIWAKVV